MQKAQFRPGFRLSSLDVIFLLCGIIGAIVFELHRWWVGLMIGTVILHFFLFCNVFRISRLPELTWGGVYLLFAASTLLTQYPGWVATTSLSVALSAFLIHRETNRQDYHGIYWQQWNPNLPNWWQRNQEYPPPLVYPYIYNFCSFLSIRQVDVWKSWAQPRKIWNGSYCHYSLLNCCASCWREIDSITN